MTVKAALWAKDEDGVVLPSRSTDLKTGFETNAFEMKYLL